jgi:hypothetical protein
MNGPAGMAAMRTVKRGFDPARRLNPGNVSDYISGRNPEIYFAATEILCVG